MGTQALAGAFKGRMGGVSRLGESDAHGKSITVEEFIDEGLEGLRKDMLTYDGSFMLTAVEAKQAMKAKAKKKAAKAKAVKKASVTQELDSTQVVELSDY